MSKKKLSTFDREMRKKEFKRKFEVEYSKFLLSEFIISIMEKDHKSVRQLAEEVGLSPTVIQKIRSGTQADIKLSNFINISEACGYNLVLEKGSQRIRIN